MTIKIGILGVTGYTGGELVRILARHPGVTLVEATSERAVGQPLTAIFPHLRGVELTCSALEPARIGANCDVVFCALPHSASLAVVPTLLESGCRVIDLSADFRLRDQATYAEWYGAPHSAPELLSGAVYGLPERYRERIGAARLVANPGCYPTSVILGLAPLLAGGLIATEGIVIDSKSGVSGAGRSAVQANLYAELEGGFRPYKAVGHRHIPEIEQELGAVAGGQIMVRFTPHLLPQSRGILSTIYVRPRTPVQDWQGVFSEFYRDEPFVRILPAGEHPSTAQVRGSNYCDIGMAWDRRTGWLVVMTTIDNLVKGAAGQAVQNLNLMLGLPETTGIAQLPLFP